MMTIFSFAYLKWIESKDESRRVLWACVIGFVVGYGLATRYLTMAAFAAPFLLHRFIPVFLRREKLRRDHIVIMIIISLFMLFIFYQNFVVTGKPLKAPNRYDKSWERLGFRDFYTPIDAIIFVFARFFYLADWVPPVFIVFYILSLFQKREFSVNTKLFRYAFFYPAIAYFFYFSWGGQSVRTQVLL